MATKTVFICENCGYNSPRWQGKCPSCDQWNTFTEQMVQSSKKTAFASGSATVIKPILLSEVKQSKVLRISTGIDELDVVLGGGLVTGSVILLGGDPGIGKSTLALQLANLLTGSGHTALYVSGEESSQQIAMRNNRLGLKQDVMVLAETNLESSIAAIQSAKPEVVVIDSVQTMYSDSAGGVTGGVAQLSYVTNSLIRLAKAEQVTIILIGHVTKEGILAGPKTIEHMVDCVLYLEGERLGNLRILRSSKNRFGSIGEVGVFEMRDVGLVEVDNPAAMFLEHKGQALAGSCVATLLEGNKVLLVEIQALTNTSNASYPRRVASGFDVNRLQLLIAIMQKTLGINLSNQDVYVNVAGGFKVTERAADLPVVMAILSSYNGKAWSKETTAFGEIGLLGEVRTVSQVDKRQKEAKKLGFGDVVHSKSLKSIKNLK
ncbi:DNA repair protein RadA [bacterium]|nr:MAG: DNA repair protein RadA [bacterium]